MSLDIEIRPERPDDAAQSWQVRSKRLPVVRAPMEPSKTSSTVFGQKVPSRYRLLPNMTADSQGPATGHRQGAHSSGDCQTPRTQCYGCIVLGNTKYYSQFGFATAPALAPSGEPEEYFMVLSLNGPAPPCRFAFDKAFHQQSELAQRDR